MGKKIFLSVLSIFLAYQTVNILSKIHDFMPSSWLMIIFLGWILNMILTGVFAFAGFAWPTQKLLPSSYYKIRNRERLKRTYKALNVGLFRKFLLATVWRKKSDQKKFFNGKYSGMKNLEVNSQKSEFGHLIPLILLLAMAGYFLIFGNYRLAIAITVWNILGNLYPVILQRYHRMRITAIRKRTESRM